MLKTRNLGSGLTRVGTLSFTSGAVNHYDYQLVDGTEQSQTDGNFMWQDTRQDHGGSWFLSRGVARRGSAQCSLNISSGTRYEGGMVGTVPSVTRPPALPTAAQYGAELYDNLAPAKPEFSFLQSLWELRELPNLFRERTRETNILRRAANRYLRNEFGWGPLLRDIRSLINAQRKGEDYLKQLIRDNGRPVRRRITKELPGSSTIVTGSGLTAFWPIISGFNVGSPTYITTTTVTDKVWGSARFRYWLPSGPQDIAWTRNMLRRIYGLDLTPEVAYNLIPWSWLTDWFFSLGPLISNINGGLEDKLAADYFYVMRERRVHVERQSMGVFRTHPSTVTLTAVSSSEQVTKTRLKGSPFGFGFTTDQLSGDQLAILGALGLSRI